jgi:tetratricopeptide (TPR) repeat protein
MELEEWPKLKQAEQLYERALQLDPDFALAAARFSQLQGWIYHNSEPTPERRQKSRALAERALQLQPDLPEAHLALGFSFYYLERDYARALQEFALAQKGLPNDAEVYLAIAIQRCQERDESNANSRSPRADPQRRGRCKTGLNYQVPKLRFGEQDDRSRPEAGEESLSLRLSKADRVSKISNTSSADQILDAKPLNEVRDVFHSAACK